MRPWVRPLVPVFLGAACAHAPPPPPRPPAVMDYDQPPRPIDLVKPKYPPDAFARKIEGTVEREIPAGP